MYQYKVIKIGNSQGIILPKKFLKAVGIDWGGKVAVEVNAKYQIMVIKPMHHAINHYYLTPDYFKWLEEMGFKLLKPKKRPGFPGRLVAKKMKSNYNY